MRRRALLALAAAMPLHAAAVDQLALPALQTAKAARSLLLGVARAGSRIVAVGERGIVVTSDDGGKSWQQASVPVSVTLTAVHFPAAATGWAVGHEGVVLRSVDGGRTWHKQFDGNAANALVLAAATERAAWASGAALKQAQHALEDAKAAAKFGPSRPLLSLWFRDEREGFVAGSYGLLLHTRDGGANWSLASDRLDNPDGLHLNFIGATPAGALVIAGEAGTVHRSTDGGASWQSLPTGYRGQLYGVLGVRDGGGEALIAFGFKGNLFRSTAKGWDALPSGTTNNLTGGLLLADGTPLLVSQDGRLVAGSADGRRFKPLPGTPWPAVAIAPAAPGTVVVTGLGGVTLVPLNAGKP